MSTQLILTIVSSPIEDFSNADLSRLVYWVDSTQSLTVGRTGFGTDVAVRQDSRMSSKHFRVAYEQGAWRVRDLGSQNGTTVDGQRIDKLAAIKNGGIIHAGGTTFGVTVLDDSRQEDAAGSDVVAEREIAGPQLADSGGTAVTEVVRRDVAGVEPLQLVLRIKSGPFGELEQANLTHVLNWLRAGQSLTVGRSYRSDFVIGQDQRMSARHFEVSCDAERARLRDLGSSNGTFVNGERVDQAELWHGDQIRAGETMFELGILGGLQSIEAAEPGPDKMTARADRDGRNAAKSATPALPAAFQDSPTDNELATAYEPMQVVLNILRGASGSVARPNVSRLLAWFGAGQTFAVGRSSTENDMRVPDDARMSGRHFELSCDGRRCRLRDLGSANGTFLNGERVLEAIVRNEDQIRAGQTVFGVAIQGGLAMSSVEVEFAAVKPLEDDTAEASAAGDRELVAMLPDIDAIFNGIKAKLRARR